MPLAGPKGDVKPAVSDVDFYRPQTVTTVQEVLDQQPYIRDSFINKTAFNPQTYAEEFQLLQRYIAGSRIRVTYFLTSTPTAGLQRATAIDPSSTRAALQTSYTQINDFEIVFQDKGLQNSFNQETTESKIYGTALLYPGMQPRNGDLFVSALGDGKFGIFQVTLVERLTFRQGANHKINFFLREWANQDAVDLIRQSVTQTVWFDKLTYLGDATTLLKEESYFFLKKLRQMRLLLIRYYYNTFYDKGLGSIVSPEGIYDPYLVNYLNTKISIQDSLVRPQQLYPNFQHYENSLWARLTDLTNRRLTNIAASHTIAQYRANRLDVSITALLNRMLVLLDNPNRQAIEQTVAPYPTPSCGPSANAVLGTAFDITLPSLLRVENDPGYVLSLNFYTGVKAAMTPLEVLVYTAIYDRKIYDFHSLIDNFLDRYSELSFSEQYYAIPLYLWLIDMGLGQISAPNSFMT